MVGTVIVGFAKYASYCGLIVVDRGIPRNSQKFIHLENFYAYGISTYECLLWHQFSVTRYLN